MSSGKSSLRFSVTIHRDDFPRLFADLEPRTGAARSRRVKVLLLSTELEPGLESPASSKEAQRSRSTRGPASAGSTAKGAHTDPPASGQKGKFVLDLGLPADGLNLPT